MLRIAIIEDADVIRLVLERYFNEQSDTSCVAAVSSVEEFLAIPLTEADSLNIVLCDIELPGGLSGIEGIALIKRRYPAVEVLMLSVHTDSERVFKALCEGAVGYLEKGTPLPMIKQHLFEVRQGGSPMSPSVARHIVRYFQPQKASAETLTPREQQIVYFIEEGLTYRQVGTRLGISLDTVRNHLRGVYRKLQVHSRAEVVALRRKTPGALRSLDSDADTAMGS